MKKLPQTLGTFGYPRYSCCVLRHTTPSPTVEQTHPDHASVNGEEGPPNRAYSAWGKILGRPRRPPIRILRARLDAWWLPPPPLTVFLPLGLPLGWWRHMHDYDVNGCAFHAPTLPKRRTIECCLCNRPRLRQRGMQPVFDDVALGAFGAQVLVMRHTLFHAIHYCL